jgi:hypothetical protein
MAASNPQSPLVPDVERKGGDTYGATQLPEKEKKLDRTIFIAVSPPQSPSSNPA